MITDRIGLHSVLLPLLIWIMKTVLNNVSPTQVLFPSLQKIDDEKLKKNLVFLFFSPAALSYLPFYDLLFSFFFIAWSDCRSLGAMESIMFLDYRFFSWIFCEFHKPSQEISAPFFQVSKLSEFILGRMKSGRPTSSFFVLTPTERCRF